MQNNVEHERFDRNIKLPLLQLNAFIHSYYRMTQPLADPRGVIDYGDVDFNQDADYF